MTTQPEALRLADALDAVPETGADPDLIQESAAELRRLHAENETLKKAVARLQQHHATAWNRGHTMGMRANEDTAQRALDGVKKDAWGNTMLTEALLKAEAQRDALLAALKFYASMMGRRKSNNEPFYMSALDLDCGDRARAAIKTVEETK